MANGDATLALPFYPAGTSVGAYPGAPAFGAVPSGTVEATVTTSASQVATFTGLVAGPHYVVDLPTAEVQTLTINATSGNFRLRRGVDTTPPLAFNITAANLKAAIEALPSVGTGQVATVTGGPGDGTGSAPYVITFGGTLAATPVGLLEVLSGVAANASTALATLAGGGASGTIALTTPGRAGNSRRIRFVPVGG